MESNNTKSYLSQIDKIKKKLFIFKDEYFETASNGTNYKVFLSKNYVIRFRDDNPKLLRREVEFLNQLDYKLIPKVLWCGEVDKSIYMVENRLPGQTIDFLWKNLSIRNKDNIVKQVVMFLQFQKTQTSAFVYSVKTGRKYVNFLDYFLDGVERKINIIKKHKQTSKTMRDLLLIINNESIKKLFVTKSEYSLVHGDLIIHNLLTNGKNLTGVLDWELALWGDSDFDLCRLFYYHECAKAYQEQGEDETFEADYMEKIVLAITKSNLIKNKRIFYKKYQFVRAIYFLNALHWAVESDDCEKNIYEIAELWNKNGTNYQNLTINIKSKLYEKN